MKSQSRATSLIVNPPRTSVSGTVVILLAIAAMSIGTAVPGVPNIYKVAVLGLLMTAAIVIKAAAAIHIVMFALLLFILPHLGRPFRMWPFLLLAPILAYAIIVACVPYLRKSCGWLRKGRVDKLVLQLVAATIVISAGALVAWIIIIKPDIGHHLAQMPEIPIWSYPFAGAGFAVLNAAMEEIVFRGIIMDTLDSALGATSFSLFLQAVPFAALHYLSGFPNGFWGFIMTLAYGVMLGFIRRLSRGMLAPFIAHTAADATIFTILAIVFFNS